MDDASAAFINHKWSALILSTYSERAKERRNNCLCFCGVATNNALAELQPAAIATVVTVCGRGAGALLERTRSEGGRDTDAPRTRYAERGTLHRQTDNTDATAPATTMIQQTCYVLYWVWGAPPFQRP